MDAPDRELARRLRAAHLERVGGICRSEYWQHHFIAADLVSQMAQEFTCSRQRAAMRLNELMVAGLIKAVGEQFSFTDDLSYYRFEAECVDLKVEDGFPLLSDVARLMSDRKKGVVVKNRKYHLRTYPNCFVASKAVSWIVRNVGISDRERAVEVGQKLVDACVIEHVTEAQPFKDKYLFFRFIPESPVLGSFPKESFNGVTFSYGLISTDQDEAVKLPSSVDVVRLMCDPASGIEVKNRKYHLKTYKKCFVASDAVSWMVNTLGLRTRARAEEMGQKLVEAQLIEHVVEPQPFKDKYLFFRFSSLLDSHSCSHSERMATLSSIHDLTGYPSSSPSPPLLGPLSLDVKRRSLNASPRSDSEDLCSSPGSLGTRVGRFSADAHPSLSSQQQANEFMREIIELPRSTSSSSFEVMVRSFPELQRKIFATTLCEASFDLTATKKAHYRRSRSPSKMSKRGGRKSLVPPRKENRVRSRSVNSSSSRPPSYRGADDDSNQEQRSRTPIAVRRAESSSFDEHIVIPREDSRGDSDYPEMPTIPDFSSDESSFITHFGDNASDSDHSSEGFTRYGGEEHSSEGSSPRHIRRATKRPVGRTSKFLVEKGTARAHRERSTKRESPIDTAALSQAAPEHDNKSRFVSIGERPLGMPAMPMTRPSPPKRCASSEAVLSPRGHCSTEKTRRSGSATSLASEDESLPLGENDWALISAIDLHMASLAKKDPEEAGLAAINLSRFICAWVRVWPKDALVKWALSLLNDWEGTPFVKETNAIKLQLLRSKPPALLRNVAGRQKARNRKSQVKERKISTTAKVIGLITTESRLFGTDVRSIAEHITLKESGLFSKIRATELLLKAWEKNETTVTTLVNRFNCMSHWTALSVCTETDLDERINVLRGFIDLASDLADMQNFNACMAVVSGLNNSSVQRLRKTWKGLPERQTSRWDELSLLMDTKNNYRAYRAALSAASRPLVPFLGVILRDITFIIDGNPCLRPGGYINLSKLLLLGEVLAEMRQHQQHRFVLDSNRFVPSLLLTIEHSWLLPLESAEVAEDNLYAISKSNE